LPVLIVDVILLESGRKNLPSGVLRIELEALQFIRTPVPLGFWRSRNPVRRGCNSWFFRAFSII
jgi:hypothetical protein